MASLSSYWSAPSGNAAKSLADINLQGSDLASDAGLAQSRILRDYSQRNLPALVNREAAKGTFYGGGAGRRADMLKEDTADAYGDITRNLSRQMANLRRSGIMAATGVMV